MSTDTPTTADADTDDDPDAYEVFRAVVKQAERNDITPGPGRAAWVITQWDERTPGEAVFMNFMGRYSAGAYTCDGCGDEPDDHPGTALVLPSDEAPKGGAAAAMAAPFCPRCALGHLRRSLR
jgi:hypothetical protein